MADQASTLKVTGDTASCPEPRLAGFGSVCQGCPGQALCQQIGGRDPEQEVINCRMNAIKHKIIIMSGKGGVGKSSVAAGLSMALAKLNHKVAICDLDICGPSIPRLLNIQEQRVIHTPYGWQPLTSPHNSVKVMSVGSLMGNKDSAVIWRGPRKTAIIRRFLKDTFWGRLDFLLFDTPPGSSDEHLTAIQGLQEVKLDGAVIVTSPQAVALSTVCREISFCRKMGLRIIGLVENMSGFVCPCCQETTDLFSSRGAERFATERSIPFLGRIPVDVSLSQSCEDGQSIIQEFQHSPAAIALIQLAECLMKQLEK
ncbi:cytosolic Fe-S cluster assembly factor NUBP2 isoform X2 [Callorhinchus milii]|uniref:cytosolic Fe-S cluster assembly factor NUBP2 isoform X2 n=1 Tax=Callorhinchus milii TaxID=7868 RepID=UPI00045725AC|nr:cytosolic Fe-S cluster assembly factor NUBP2 isoform X2 [Callorhinchus milii]|eukprot:gi/632956589/ref/XP_007894032.1/ PREDICTED: cytosolic Fe-S cluster assembly factor NUBP2-like isoform X2 [Callorhinchus milii]